MTHPTEYPRYACWKTMMDDRFYVSASETAWGEAKAVYNGPHHADHALWLGKVGLLVTDYAKDPLRAYTDPNKIGTYQFDGQQWSSSNDNYMDRGLKITLPFESSAAQQLNMDRNFRIENWIERIKHPLDQSIKMRSR